MGTMQEIANRVRGNLIPRYYFLRRIPLRYRRILPLTIMKRYQCLVIGAAQGVLTVAIADPQNTSAIESLRKLTGQAIFPVLIDPVRMRLLIQRIERNEKHGYAFYRKAYERRMAQYYPYIFYRLQVASTLPSLFYTRKKRS